jgi:hypothetical protein
MAICMSTLECITPRVEVLESRIAPASITFTDVDGVTVKITSSKGTVADLEEAAILVAEGSGQELRELRLSDAASVFKGANISIVKGTLDDTQFVDVGFINATGLDLGKVTIDGDLGRILAGDEKSATIATKKLTVGSIGVEGLNTQAAGGNLISKFLGRLGSLVVKGDFKEASLTVLGIDPDPDEGESTFIDARGDIGGIFIGGNLIGGAAAKTGYIYAKGSIGNIEVTGSVLGSAGEFSGSITSERTMGKVKVGGDVQGGLLLTSNLSGRIFSAEGMGSVTVGGSLKGGDGMESANISTAGRLGNVTILGDIIGGLGLKSGAVGAGGQIGKITIGTATSGGNITGAGGEQSGSILSGGNMKAVKVFGDITGGDQMFAGSITSDGKIASAFVDGSMSGGDGEQSGAIGSSLALGAVTVMGNLIGGDGKNSAVITSSKSIDSVHVEGSVQGGDGEQSGAIGCITNLGPVTIDGDLLGGSNISSGSILSGQLIARVEIGGSMKGITTGTAGVGSASIKCAGYIGTVIIHGDVFGGNANNTAQIFGQSINRVQIDGNVEQGRGVDTGSVIASTGNLVSLTIMGSVTLFDDPSHETGYPLRFSAGDSIGAATFGSLHGTRFFSPGFITAVNTIGTVTVVDSAEYFNILAGYDPAERPVNSAAKINKVIIGTTGEGEMLGVDIVAGVRPNDFGPAGEGEFGDADDLPISPFTSKAVSRIASVVVKGSVVPSSNANDFYGIVAGQIDSVSIGGVSVDLTSDLDVIEIEPSIPTRVTIREVSFTG